jgi:hypothetical protein
MGSTGTPRIEQVHTVIDRELVRGRAMPPGSPVEPPVRWGPRQRASSLASRRIGDGVLGTATADTARRSYGPAVPHALRSHQRQSSSGSPGASSA